jgi:curli biogenesis system outer membrane secretion channel CsgG
MLIKKVNACHSFAVVLTAHLFKQFNSTTSSVGKSLSVAGSLAVVLSTGLSGCVGTKISTTTELPPNNLAAASLHKIAVLPFQGPGGDQATVEIESALAQITQNGQSFFTVIDRRTLQNALNELKLHDTGLVDEKTAVKIGHLIGAEGVYTGSVFMPPIVRQSHKETRSKCNDAPSSSLFSKCKSSSDYSVSCTKKVAQYTLIPRLVEIKTAHIIYQPTITATSENSFCAEADTQGEEADEVLRGNAHTEVMTKFKKDVGPHMETFDLTIKTDESALTDKAKQQFRDSLAFAKSGRMDRACAAWRSLQQENADNVAVRYDIAVCDEVAGNLSQALAGFKAIDTNLSRPDKDVNEALTRVQGKIDAEQKMLLMAVPPPQPITQTPPTRAVPRSAKPTKK